jgi:response regulator RpfG family c-di-GMP phosphodiesterase
MIRPCYLVLDREFPGNISTRKLVIETAKLNVITAYDPEEAIATLERFPRVDGVVFNAGTLGMSVEKMIERLRQIVPGITVIVTAATSPRRNTANEFYIDSLDPAALLECLEGLNREAMEEIERRDPEVNQ